MNNELDLNQFLAKATELLNQILDDDIGFVLTRGTNLISEIGDKSVDLSSIDYVDFLVAIENEYNIVYDFDAKIETVGDMYHYIMKYRDKHKDDKNEEL